MASNVIFRYDWPIKPQNVCPWLVKSNQSNFNFRSPDCYWVRSYLITTVMKSANGGLLCRPLYVCLLLLYLLLSAIKYVRYKENGTKYYPISILLKILLSTFLVCCQNSNIPLHKKVEILSVDKLGPFVYKMCCNFATLNSIINEQARLAFLDFFHPYFQFFM